MELVHTTSCHNDLHHDLALVLECVGWFHAPMVCIFNQFVVVFS